MNNIVTVWKLIGNLEKKRQIYWSILVSFMSMIFDALLLIVMYELITAIELNTQYVSLDKLSTYVGLHVPSFQIAHWAVFVGLVTIIANIIRAYNIKLIINITYGSELKINECMFERKIQGPYDRFISENQFDDHKEILTEARIVVQSVMSFTFVCLGVFQMVGIMIALSLTDPFNSFILFLVITVIYFVILTILTNPIKRASLVRSDADTNRIALLNEALANIKQIKVGKDEPYILDRLFSYAKSFHDANAQVKWLGVLPRYIIEGGVLSGISLLIALLLFRNGSIQLPSLASVTLIAVAAARLIPAAQKIYNGAVNISFSHNATLRILHKLEDLTTDNLSSRNPELEVYEDFNLTARNVGFSYAPAKTETIKNINFCFHSGQLNFIIGESGSGKSTLCDLITGLLPTSNGTLQFKSTQSDKKIYPIIRYIPQDSFLLSGTVAFNLLGKEASSEKKFHRAKQLIINFGLVDNDMDAINFLNTQVREFGRNFSGGQKQRLSIIRGLLQNANVLILDEAFSALDTQNALSVLTELENTISAKMMIVIITHDKDIIQGRKHVELSKPHHNR